MRRAVPRLPAAIWALGGVSLLMDVSSEMIHSLLPVFLVTGLGASIVTVGFIEGAAEAMASITKLFSGWISDHMGRRKPLTVLGYAISAASKPFFPLASSALTVLAARLTDRLGKGVREAPRDALLAELTPAGASGAAFGLRQSLDTLGAVGGPLLAVALMALFSGDVRRVFAWAVAPAVLAVVLMIFGVREPDKTAANNRVRPVLRWSMARDLGPAVWWIIALSAAFSLARFSEAFLLLRGRSLHVALGDIPWIMVLMNLVYALTAAPAGRLSDRIGRRSLLAGGMAVLILADAALAFAPNLAVLGVGVALWGLHLGLTQGLLASLVADAAPPRLRGGAFGVFYLVTGLVLLAGGVAAGALWGALGPRAVFLIGGALALGALLMLVLTSRPRSAAASGD
ncbi:MAG: MFS transporter [Caulobacterales bacterium]